MPRNKPGGRVLAFFCVCSLEPHRVCHSMTFRQVMQSGHLSNAKSWLNNSMMNLLIDYYPEIQFRPYGTGCTLDNTVPWIRDLDLGYVCIYAKGHSGYTTWKSALGTHHRMLGRNMPAFFREVASRAGCRLILYYSGMLDGIAGLRHPDWIMRDFEDKPKSFFGEFRSFFSYGICPRSRYWEDWVSVHLKELFSSCDPDGIWVDGDWAGPCFCPRCQEAFRKATRWDGRWEEMKRRPDFMQEYSRFWLQTEHEWRMRFSAEVRRLKPDAVYSAGNVSPRREFAGPFDWRSGDFFSPGFFNLAPMAQMMRWYATLDLPADAYICDTSFTHARKHVRSRTKTAQRMMQEAATVASAGGRVGYWTYPQGDGALMPSRMRKAIAVRRFLKEREHLFLGSMPVAWTGIVSTDDSVQRFIGGEGIQGAHKALAALHRSPLVMDDGALGPDMPWDLLVVPEEARMSDRAAERLAAFVERGGKLLTSGSTIRVKAVQDLLGAFPVEGEAEADGHVFLRDEPFGEPTGIDCPWDRLELKGAEELYPLYRSWDSRNPECRNLDNNWPMHGHVDELDPEPAGCPAAVARRIGKGMMIHIATGIFAFYQRFGDPQILRWLREVLSILQPRPFFSTDAPSWVDVSLRRSRDGSLLVHFVNQNPGRDISRLHADDVWVDEIPETGGFRAALRVSERPKTVVFEPGGIRVDWSFSDGLLEFAVPRFHIHGAIVADGV